MKKFKVITLTLCLGIVMVGCNNTQKGAAIGTGGGAVLGAIIGKIAGNTAVGAAIGGAVGAGAGAIIGNRMDKAKKEAEAVRNAQVQQVTQIKSVNGYGQDNPVADNSTAAGQAQNRRVEIIMYASQQMIQAAENGTLK